MFKDIIRILIPVLAAIGWYFVGTGAISQVQLDSVLDTIGILTQTSEVATWDIEQFWE